MVSIKVSFRDAVFENGYMWIFDNLLQAICRIDIDNFILEIVSQYRSKEKFIVRKIFLYKDKFWLVSENSLNVLIYDRKKEGENEAFCLQRADAFNELNGYVTFMHNDYIYFFPRDIDRGVFCFNISTKTYLKRTLLRDYLVENIGKAHLKAKNFRYYKGCIWFVLKNTEFYIRYNLDTRKAEIFQARGNVVLNSCCFDGEQVWMAEEDSDIITCKERHLIQMPERQLDTRLYLIDKWVVVFSKGSNDIFLVDRKTLKIAVLELPLLRKEKQDVVQEIYQHGNYVFLLYMESLYVLDKRTLEVRNVKIKSENYIEHCFENENVLLTEDNQINLQHLLQFCGYNGSFTCEQNRSKDDAGKAIWKVI